MKKIFFILTFVTFCFSLSYANSSEDIIKANKLYMKGKYKEAIDLYSKIQSQNQKDSKINYNLACACYRDGQFDKALEYYKGSLKLNSSDIDAKHNVEFLQQEQQQNKNNSKDNKDNKDKDNKNNQQNENKDNNQQDKDKDKDNKDQNKDQNEDKQQNQNDKNDKNKDEKDKQQQEEEKKKQEEKNKNQQNQQLLDYFDRQDKQNNDKSKEGYAVQRAKSGKNW